MKTINDLPPATRAAVELAQDLLLQVALAGEEHHPGDAFTRVPESVHIEHAMAHAERASWRVNSADPVTGLPDWAHAFLRFALADWVHRHLCEVCGQRIPDAEIPAVKNFAWMHRDCWRREGREE